MANRPRKRTVSTAADAPTAKRHQAGTAHQASPNVGTPGPSWVNDAFAGALTDDEDVPADVPDLLPTSWPSQKQTAETGHTVVSAPQGLDDVSPVGTADNGALGFAAARPTPPLAVPPIASVEQPGAVVSAAHGVEPALSTVEALPPPAAVAPPTPALTVAAPRPLTPHTDGSAQPVTPIAPANLQRWLRFAKAHAFVINRVPDEALSAIASRSRLRAEHQIDTQRVEQSSAALLGRLERMLSFVDAARGISAVQLLANDCTWGPRSAFADKSKMLCKAGTSVPITVWFVGEITTSWSIDRDGDPADRVTVNFVPLRQSLTAACATQLTTLSKPQDLSCCSSWGPGQVRAYTWMNTGPRRPGVPQNPATFVEYFDATTRLQDKARMERLPIQGLQEHDLVLVEAGINRYAKAGNDSSTVEKQGRGPPRRATIGMDRWVAYYNLQAVYLLEAAPAPLEAERVDLGAFEI